MTTQAESGVVVFYNTKDLYDLGTPDSVIEKWFGRAVDVLRHRSISATLTQRSDEVIALIARHSRSPHPVLIVSHGIPFELEGELPPNIREYGPRSIAKSVQYDRMRSRGIPVADWIVAPRDWGEVFAKLGPHVVVKPDHGLGLGRDVRWVTGDDYAHLGLRPDHLYCKYVGAERPPYWVARVICLFGEPVAAYIKRQDGERIMHVLPSAGATIEARIDPALVALGARASQVMFEEFGCAMAGVDITGDATGAYVLEVNMFGVGLGATEFASAEAVHERVAEACIKQLRAAGADPAASP